MNTIETETYRASDGRRYKISLNGKISVNKILEESELSGTMDFEPFIGEQPVRGGDVRFQEPVPEDLVVRCQQLDRKRRKEHLLVA